MNSQKTDKRLGTETMLQPVNVDIRRSPTFWRITVCVYVCIFVTGLSHAQGANKTGLYSDRIAAVVNGFAILESDIKLHKQPFVRNFTNLGLNIVPRGKDPTYREILDELIVYELLRQEARKKNMKIDDSSLNVTLREMAKRNRMSPEEFALFVVSKGVSYSDFREMMRQRLILDEIIALEVTRKLVLSEEDAQKFYKENADKIEDMYNKLLQQSKSGNPTPEEKKIELPTHENRYVGGKVRLYQISLHIPSKANKKEKKRVVEKAIKIYRAAMTGADFSKLAKKYSQDVYAASGGDIGWMNYADMIPQVQNIVQRMEVGRVLPPVQGRNEFVIFYLADAKGRRIKKVPIPEKIRKKMRKQYEEQQKAMLERLKKQQNDAKASNSKKKLIQEKQVPTKNLGILNPEEAKKYRKVHTKVYTILRMKKIHNRIKEWIEELKKNALIEIKL
jgi:parvulin-like peptidyl-prolyl isomerase